jgi:hypothetical protein
MINFSAIPWREKATLNDMMMMMIMSAFSPRVMYTGVVNPRTIELVFVASPLKTQH